MKVATVPHAVAIGTYRTLYDSFDRTCTEDADCTWYDNLGECGCAHFGSIDADPSEIYAAKEEIAEKCTPPEKVENDFCDNNFVCSFQEDGSPDGTAIAKLFCDAGQCAVR